MYLHHDDLVAVQNSLREAVELVLVGLEPDSLARFDALGAPVDAVNHGKVEPGAEIPAGALEDNHVAVVIVVDFPHSLLDFTGHLIFTNADSIVLVRTV